MQDKVYLNVSESDIFYRFQNFKFYFSSRATRERFIRKLDSYIQEEEIKFINKYNVRIENTSFDLMFAFILYNKTEKRGFKIERYVDNQLIKVIEEMPIFTIWGDVTNG